MKIALTGGSGRLGQAIQAEALRRGHGVVSIDLMQPASQEPAPNLRFIKADTSSFEQLEKAFEGCDALIHMAAIPSPGRLPDHQVHNNNVVGSYNALRAAVEQGITSVCLASSVNAVGLLFSQNPRFDYFPIDEAHPNYCEDPYSLSKWIGEQQADAFARRYPDMRIASMRFHLTVEARADGARINSANDRLGAKQLWGYTRFDAAADACLRSLEARFSGHEAFYIVAPDTTEETDSQALAARYYPDVKMKSMLEGRQSFFSAAKAERVLGWVHDSPQAAANNPNQKHPEGTQNENY